MVVYKGLISPLEENDAITGTHRIFGESYTDFDTIMFIFLF